jgi:hypothetical protein
MKTNNCTLTMEERWQDDSVRQEEYLYQSNLLLYTPRYCAGLLTAVVF